MSTRSALLACLLVAGLSTPTLAHVPKNVACQGFLATAIDNNGWMQGWFQVVNP